MIQVLVDSEMMMRIIEIRLLSCKFRLNLARTANFDKRKSAHDVIESATGTKWTGRA
jgi:hypothetical protein